MSFLDDMGEIVAIMSKIGPAIPQIEQIIEDGWNGVQEGKVSIQDFVKAGKEAVELYQSFESARPKTNDPSAPPEPETTVTTDDLNEQELEQIEKFRAGLPWMA